MKLCVIGCGYVGLVSAACFADLGHTVMCVDTDAARIAMLRRGESPIYEVGLSGLLTTHRSRLQFTEDMVAALEGAEIAFICVGTPPIPETGEANLSYVFAAAEQISAHVTTPLVVVTKSTVPVGTNRALLERFGTDTLRFASNPEFLREGSAISDFMRPDRIVVGVVDDASKQTLHALYRPLLTRHHAPFVATGLESAEMIKYASNTFLAVRIAFINEIADICEQVGGDIEDVAHGMGLDPRIGTRYLRPGPGYGGSCFPKDTRALRAIARNKVVDAPITYAVVESNERRRGKMVEKILNAFEGNVQGLRLAVLGLTFKPDTNDMRESPALDIVPALLARGASIRAYDPEGMEEAAYYLSHPHLTFAISVEEAVKETDGGIILTEWNVFRTLEPLWFSNRLRQPIVVDLRNIYDPTAMQKAGIRYVSVGR
jgi:UDPglucose 6-dehydrogenase